MAYRITLHTVDDLVRSLSRPENERQATMPSDNSDS